jgi:hypothetical protein
MLKHAGERQSQGPALLDCQANPSCGQWTRHVFKEARQVTVEHEPGRKMPAIEEVYACSGCGAERRWGLR